MATLYKLTTSDGYTRKGEYNQCKWGPMVRHSGTGKGGLCSPGYVHAYTSPLLAVLLNPIHAAIRDPKLWIAEGDVVKNDRGLKVGCISLTTVREIPLPVISTTQRAAFAILCAKEVCKDRGWNRWADNWLSGKDRSYAAAYAAYAARATYAAYAARAARAAYAAYAADAAAAAYAADAAAAADAADAADAAAAAGIDIIRLAEEAMKY